MKLSILDVLPVLSGSTAADAVRRAGSLAQAGDRLGYERLWYAEHHGMQGIASSVPDLMIAHVGGLTSRIRLGSGGVMLQNHVPLRVVEEYRTLEALFPGRIDLGIGRAPGTDPETIRALRSGDPNRFPQELMELTAFGSSGFPRDHRFHRVFATPEGVRLPPIFLLGSSGASAELAGQLGMGYGFAGHFSPTPGGPALAAYRRRFEPSELFKEPHGILAMNVIVAETHDEAVELSSSIQIVFERMARGERGVAPSPAEARAMGWTPQFRSINPMTRLLVVGTPDEAKARIQQEADESWADEIMVMTLVHDPTARIRSYELLAQVFGMETEAPSGSTAQGVSEQANR